MRNNQVTQCLITALVLFSLPLPAAETPPKTPTTKNQPTTPGKKSANLKVPDGFFSHIFADEALINNPLSITIDRQNRVYVAESNRFLRGVVDSRKYNDWFLDEIACHSLADRQKLYDKYIANKTFSATYFTEFSDQITTLIDSNHDGIADKNLIYADGFNASLDGNGSSVLMGLNGEMYYANIPHIWKIYDQDGDGISESREPFVSGVGFRNGVNGHDLHGLEWGVDGRIYFSNGDRGYGITTKEGKLLYSAERGAIFRCEPDGTNLEEFCIGNRNPQDLGFDQYGNLFTVDNNRGSGDSSRVCYLVEQGDYGWNSGHENKRTFFNAVKLHLRAGPIPIDQWTSLGEWRTAFPEQPAYSIPSMEYIPGGSVGITFNPGDSMGPDYKNHFFYCAYSQGINTFRFTPHGGGLKIENLSTFGKGGQFTATEFTTDGRLLIADYVNTQNAPEGSKKGLIYSVENKKYTETPSVIDAAKKLSKGFADASVDDLYQNLFHEDMRIRLFSQFTLVKKGADGITKCKMAAEQQTHELARLHGIWGLGQIARQTGDHSGLNHLVPLLKDNSWQVRAQAAKVLGESKNEKYLSAILPMIADVHDRVRFFVLTALGKIAGKSASQVSEALLAQIKTINDGDVFLRHAATVGLIYLGQHTPSTTDFLAQQSTNDSAPIRRVCMLALARLGDSRVTLFLNDKDQSITQETILAVDRMNNHALLQQTFGTLARCVDGTPPINAPFQERLLQWCFRVGDENAARLVTRYLLNDSAPEELRRVALQDLKRWQITPPVDPVIGQIRPVNSVRFDVTPILKEALTALMKPKKITPGFEAEILVSALNFNLMVDEKAIAEKIFSPLVPTDSRINFFDKLVESGYPGINSFIDKLLTDNLLEMRAAAYGAVARIDKEKFKNSIKENQDRDSQAIYLSLIRMKKHSYNEFLAKQFDKLHAGTHPKDSEIELLEAAKVSGNADLKKAADTYEKSLKQSKDPLAIYHGALYGGDPVIGRKLIVEQSVGQCVICHKFEGKGGIVAPDLSQIAMEKRATREYLLESLILPSAQVVPGFGNMTATLKNGETLMGSFLKQDDKWLTLKFVDGQTKDVALSDITSRTPAVSLMPPMGAMLKPDEIRNIIAYLFTLNKPVGQIKGDH